ncbi:anoctamin-7-like [Dendroctonus ponderosae]|uniref:anoctamin-7-like n=1 Tax=Dendroctonus ponderosae TaxID=77166 RepID=UPI0020352F43|nr:anoctamin-7-like [Dendroctonus ponderosae]
MAFASAAKRPDYVLVVKEETLPLISTYISNLKMLGLDVEYAKGLTVDLMFIKVFIAPDALAHFSQIYDIGTSDPSLTAGFYSEPVIPTPFRNPLVHSIGLSYLRGELTEAEKIMVVNRVLENAKYGEKEREFGLTKLIQVGAIETGYPLHDGPISENGTNYRSLLYRHWSNTRVTHMEQPLDTIFRYFGNEVAFYFAWLEYFNLMLAIPAVLGALTFLGSLIFVLLGQPYQVQEVCENSNMLCPTCEGNEGCRFKHIYKYCSLAQWSVVFDNTGTVAYAVFISFWATLFIALWRRKENKLKFRWNCVEDVRETQIRQPYLDKAIKQQLNRITGEIEQYTPRCQVVLQYSLTFTACSILVKKSPFYQQFWQKPVSSSYF